MKVDGSDTCSSCGSDRCRWRRWPCGVLLSPEGLERWSPENPRLYKVEFTAGDDHLTDDVGFRTIEVQGDQILLNGKSIFLRGVNIHAEAPYRSGRAWSEQDASTLLGWAKELHCNFVRLAHYPHDEHMTRLADKLGILVWSEIPVYWSIDWTNQHTYDVAKQQLDEMIRRDRNKASVILWSMSNETPVSDARTAFIGKLAARGAPAGPHAADHVGNAHAHSRQNRRPQRSAGSRPRCARVQRIHRLVHGQARRRAFIQVGRSDAQAGDHSANLAAEPKPACTAPQISASPRNIRRKYSKSSSLCFAICRSCGA